jgi:hypothetical protein
MLIWNGMGAMDYVMTVSRDVDYLAQFTPERLAFLDAFPVWAKGSWALAVWLYVIGTVLLLWRSRFAVRFLISGFVFLIVTTFHNLILATVPALETMTAFEMVFSLVIMILAILQIAYAEYMRRLGVLR